MTQTQPQKLNLFQRGILQKVAIVVVYFASFAAGAFILDWLEKRRFIVVAEKAQQQGILTPESFRNLKAQIVAMDVTAIFAIIILLTICFPKVMSSSGILDGNQPGQNPGRTATRPGVAQPGLAAAPGGEQPDKGRFASLDAAIGRLSRVIQELGSIIAALERHIERQIDRARERSRGPGMKM